MYIVELLTCTMYMEHSTVYCVLRTTYMCYVHRTSKQGTMYMYKGIALLCTRVLLCTSTYVVAATVDLRPRSSLVVWNVEWVDEMCLRARERERGHLWRSVRAGTQHSLPFYAPQ